MNISQDKLDALIAEKAALMLKERDLAESARLANERAEARDAEISQRLQAERLAYEAREAKGAPAARKSAPAAGSRGGKRAEIKKAWLTDSNFSLKPSAMLAKLEAMGIASTESSIASIRSDLKACMMAIRHALSERFELMLAGSKGLRENDPLAALNAALYANRALSRDQAIEMLAGSGASAAFIGGSLAASKESLAILQEMGAFDKSAEIIRLAA